MCYKKFLLIIVACYISLTANAQVTKRVRLDSNSIVMDYTGQNVLPYHVWKPLFASRKYKLKIIDTANLEAGFVLIKISDEEYNENVKNTPQPKESEFFKTGDKFPNFKEKDIEGNKFSLKELKGKIVVINFWFVNCSPCRNEIPHLNELVSKHANDSSIVFLAFCLDDKDMVKEFLKNQSFKYHQFYNMRYFTAALGVKSYPTHVVLDKNGKITHHSTGYSMATIPWLEKAIVSLAEPNVQ